MARNIKFHNVFNFRDLGGYPTADGAALRWRRLFRADDLSRLTEPDHPGFLALGIRTVIDLRRPEEVEQWGRVPPLHGVRYQHVHLVHPRWPVMEFADTGARADFVRDRYLEMSEFGSAAISEALRLIAEERCTPLVFHCYSGKDRTGVIAALVLALLGVADEVIAADYELSEAAEDQRWHWRTRADPDLAGRRWTHVTVSPGEGMLAFLHELRRRHGSIEGYVAQLGVTSEHLAAMRTHLLERQR
ncbi:MAG TPA: tyrosine-protein phosphatase [Micromonosporaceae bacterium]